MAGKGGARVGTGPKPGSHTSRATILTRRKAAAIIESGLSPLDVMMANLRFWNKEAHLLEKVIRENLPTDASILQLDDKLGLVGRFLDAKDKLMATAEKTAPYIHPRISPVHDQPGGVRDLSKLTDKELDALEHISRKLAGSYGDPGGEAAPKG